MQKVKYQAVLVTVAAGTTGTVSQAVELDPAYSLCTGIAVYEKKNGGISSYDIALADDNKVYHDFVDKADYMPATSVAPDERYKSMHVENAKQRFKVRVTPDAAPATDIVFQMVFRLQN